MEEIGGCLDEIKNLVKNVKENLIKSMTHDQKLKIGQI